MKSIEEAIAALAEDEAWQGNLEDSERTLLLSWAEQRLRGRMEQELAEIQARLRTVNQVLSPLGDQWISRPEVLKAIVGIGQITHITDTGAREYGVG